MPASAEASSDARPPVGAVLAGAALGGALAGVTDASRVLASTALAPGPLARTGLVVLDAALLTVFAVLAATATLPLARRAAAPKWWGFCWGLAATVTLYAGERWFTRPPPHTEAPPLHGNPLVFAAGFALLVGLTWALARGLRCARCRLVAAPGITGLLAAWVTASARSLPLRGTPVAGAPDVLLVTFDTTRADHVAATGAPAPAWLHGRAVQTPNLDRLAAEGARFTRAFAQIPVTGPSHTTILSGLAPWEHGNLLNGVPVPDDVPLLAEAFRAAGYRTAAFVSAYVLDSSIHLDRGFDVYDDDFGWLPGWSVSLPGRVVRAVARHLSPDEVLERRADRTVDAALRWMAAQPEDAPRFVWVHLFDPHGPYTPPPPWDTAYYEGDPRDPAHTSMARATDIASYLLPYLEGITDADWVRAQYAGEISYADQEFGRLLDALDASGRADHTLVAAMADHGESLGEHGVWFNHGGDLYEAATHVPLVLRLPGEVPAGAVVDDPVELTDVAPTIAELVGLKLPGPVGGRSLAPAIFGGKGRPFARSMCFDREANLRGRERGEIDRPTWRMVAIRGPDSRFVYREAPGTGEVFYDLAADPLEREPAALDPALAETLRGIARGLLDHMDAEDVQRSGADLDPATAAKLKALGYVE